MIAFLPKLITFLSQLSIEPYTDPYLYDLELSITDMLDFLDSFVDDYHNALICLHNYVDTMPLYSNEKIHIMVYRLDRLVNAGKLILSDIHTITLNISYQQLKYQRYADTNVIALIQDLPDHNYFSVEQQMLVVLEHVVHRLA